MKTLLKRLAVVASGAILGLLALEGAVRLLLPPNEVLWVPDPRLGWRNAPGAKRLFTEEGRGFVRINEWGFRDLEPPADKNPGTYRIAILGDSMTEAVQVDFEQTYCFLLERKLVAAGKRVEVINLGVVGYSPLQEWLLLREQAPRLKPDLVVWAIFTDNDVAEIDERLNTGREGAPFARLVDGKLQLDNSGAQRSDEEFRREPTYTIRRFSALYRLLSDRLRRRRAAEAAAVGAGVPKRFLLYEVPAPAEWEEAWLTLDAIVSQFSRDVQSAGAQLLIVSVPAAQVVSPPAWTATLERYPAMAEGRWNLEGPRERLAAIAERRRVRLFDPHAGFSERATKEELFFGQLGHFTPRGHELMAEILSRYLIESGVLP